MLPASMCQVVEVSAPAQADESGAPATDEWGIPVDSGVGDGGSSPVSWAPIERASLQPMQGLPASESNGANFDQTVESWRLFVPPGVHLRTTDRVRQGVNPLAPVSDSNPAAVDLEVYGEFTVWPGPDGLPHHGEVSLKAYGGGH